MGKRSNFKRVDRDFYPTPERAVMPLWKHLPALFTYVEPCAGNGALVNSIPGLCIGAYDIEPQADHIIRGDAMDLGWLYGCADLIITNPPWDRKILHPMIELLSAHKPTWLLFDADWMHTVQATPYLPWCRKVVSIGRVKWIADSKYTGKDNCCWYLFDQNRRGSTQFIGRDNAAKVRRQHRCEPERDSQRA